MRRILLALTAILGLALFAGTSTAGEGRHDRNERFVHREIKRDDFRGHERRENDRREHERHEHRR
jgi:hypothetical protein